MESEDKRDYPFFGEDQDEVKTRVTLGATHSTKISGNFGKLNGSVRSNRKSFEKTGLFSQSERSEFWLNGSRPQTESCFFFLIKIHFKLR